MEPRSTLRKSGQPAKGEQRKPEHLARNPFGRLPVLELDDGSSLIESLAIIEYLEECLSRTATDRPECAGTCARARGLERIAELGVLLPVGRIIHATNSPIGLLSKSRGGGTLSQHSARGAAILGHTFV